jgi:hypothetical protein
VPREHWFIYSAVITIVIINIYKQKSSSIVLVLAVDMYILENY